MKLQLGILLAIVCRCSAQSTSSVELYGPVPALQIYNALGTNISPSNSWEYQAAQEAHISWGRFDCPWQSVEQQSLPRNLSLGYVLPTSCALGLANGKHYQVHSIVDALYGAPFGKIASGILDEDVSVGSVTLPMHLTSGSLEYVKPGQTYVKYGNDNISSKHAYAGSLIVGSTADTVTLASAMSVALPRGSVLTVNLQLYAPVLIPPDTIYQSNSSLRAYGNYVHFLQTQVAASGFPGRVSLWNEPPWGGDPWDDAANLYDVPPPERRFKAHFGVELAYFAVRLPAMPNALLDNGYTNKSANGSLLQPARSSEFAGKDSILNSVASESFHPYGNNPEDGAWDPSCVRTHSTPQTLGKVFTDCTPPGMVVGSNTKWEAAFSLSFDALHGMSLGITETGLCRCSKGGVTEQQVSRFDVRQFLVFAGADVHPIIFYRLAGDKSFEWLHSDHSPYPVYSTFQMIMRDLGEIAHPSIASSSTTKLPTVTSYEGAFPLAMAVFVGSRLGDSVSSLAVYTWQRSYSSGSWLALPSPSASQVAMSIPLGLEVNKVINTVSTVPVTFSFHRHILIYAVTDDPIEIMLTPEHVAKSQ